MAASLNHQSGRRHATMTNHNPSFLEQDIDGVLVAGPGNVTRPRQLLDLPVEILNAILREACRFTAALARID